MKKVILFLAIVVGLSNLQAQSTSWGFDKSHSEIIFSVTHMLITELSGNFGEYDIKVTSEKADFSGAEISFSAQVSSINTGVDKRDQHLRSEEFFYAEKFPQITFKSKSFTKTGDNEYKLVGDFTMRGVTKEITLDVIYKGTIKGPWGNTRAGFQLNGKVNRFDFGLQWNSKIETGGLVVGEMVEIICNIELIKK